MRICTIEALYVLYTHSKSIEFYKPLENKEWAK